MPQVTRTMSMFVRTFLAPFLTTIITGVHARHPPRILGDRAATKPALARRRPAATWPGREGEASDERGESVAPDPGFLAGRHLPAQFDRGEPLAERMELARSVPHRAAAEQSGHLDPGHPGLEAGESLPSGGSELYCQLWRARRLLDADPEQGRVSDGEAPEHRDAGFDEVSGGIPGCRQPGDRFAEHGERAGA